MAGHVAQGLARTGLLKTSAVKPKGTEAQGHTDTKTSPLQPQGTRASAGHDVEVVPSVYRVVALFQVLFILCCLALFFWRLIVSTDACDGRPVAMKSVFLSMGTTLSIGAGMLGTFAICLFCCAEAEEDLHDDDGDSMSWNWLISACWGL